MKKILLFFALFSFLTMAGACGYKFSRGGLLPGDKKHVAVLMFRNKTLESGVEKVFADALSVEIMDMSDSIVVKMEDADAYFKGVVKSVSISALTRKSDDTVMERRVSAVIDLSMVDKNGKVLWSVNDFSDTEEYRVTTENITDMASRSFGITRIAQRISQKLVTGMLDRF